MSSARVASRSRRRRFALFSDQLEFGVDLGSSGDVTTRETIGRLWVRKRGGEEQLSLVSVMRQGGTKSRPGVRGHHQVFFRLLEEGWRR